MQGDVRGKRRRTQSVTASTRPPAMPVGKPDFMGLPVCRCLPRMSGHAHVAFAEEDGATRLAKLRGASPLRVLFPPVDAHQPPLVAVTVVSGEIVGGGRLDVSVAVYADAKAVMLGQAAEKIYRSAGPDSRVNVSLDVDRGGWLEWLPQEAILFDGAGLDRRIFIVAGVSGKVLAGELLVFGRLAGGEAMRRGFLRDRWEARRGGRLAWADSLLVDGNVSTRLNALAGFDGARTCATALYADPDGERYLDEARDLTINAVDACAGASLVHGVLVARWLSDDPLTVRRSLERYWTAMRNAAGGLSARLPCLWYAQERREDT